MMVMTWLGRGCMHGVQMPDRKPEYRGARDHASFLTRLKDCLRLDDAQHDDDEDNRWAGESTNGIIGREVGSEVVSACGQGGGVP